MHLQMLQKNKKIKEEIKAHEGQVAEMTLEKWTETSKNKFGRLIEVYPSYLLSSIRTTILQVKSS